MSIWIYPYRNEFSGSVPEYIDGNCLWLKYKSANNNTSPYATDTLYCGLQQWSTMRGAGTADTDYSESVSYTFPDYYWSGMGRWLLLWVSLSNDDSTTGASTFGSTLTNVTCDGVTGTLIASDTVDTTAAHTHGAGIHAGAHYIYGWKDSELPSNPSRPQQSVTIAWETNFITTASNPRFMWAIIPISGVDQTTTFANLVHKTSETDQYPNMTYETPSVRERVRLNFQSTYGNVSGSTSGTLAGEPMWVPTETAKMDMAGHLTFAEEATNNNFGIRMSMGSMTDPTAILALNTTHESHATTDSTANLVWTCSSIDVIPLSTMDQRFEGSAWSLVEVADPAPSTGNATINVSFSYTLNTASGNDRILMAIIHHLCQDDTAQNVTNLQANATTSTFNSVASTGTCIHSTMDYDAFVDFNNGAITVLYWLDADLPSTTGTYTLSCDSDITKSTSCDKNTIVVECHEWTGVDQTNPFGDVGSALPIAWPDTTDSYQSTQEKSELNGYALFTGGGLSQRGSWTHAGVTGYESNNGANSRLVDSAYDAWNEWGIEFINHQENWGPDRAQFMSYCSLVGFGGHGAYTGATRNSHWDNSVFVINMQRAQGDAQPRVSYILQRRGEPAPPGNPKGVLGHPLHGALAGPVGP